MYEPDPAGFVGMLAIDPKVTERLKAASNQQLVWKWPAYERIALADGEKLWSEHVYIPSEVIEDVFAQMYERELDEEEKLAALKYTGAMAWARTQGYYRFEPEFERKLMAQKEFPMSVDTLLQLPAQCVAISVGGVLPIFVFFDYDIKARQLYLGQIALSRGGTQVFRIPVAGTTVADMISADNATPQQIKAFGWLLPLVMRLCSLGLDHSAQQDMPKNYLVSETGAVVC